MAGYEVAVLQSTSVKVGKEVFFVFLTPYIFVYLYFCMIKRDDEEPMRVTSCTG